MPPPRRLGPAALRSARPGGRAAASGADRRGRREHGDGARLLHLPAALRRDPLHDRVRRLQGLVPRQVTHRARHPEPGPGPAAPGAPAAALPPAGLPGAGKEEPRFPAPLPRSPRAGFVCFVGLGPNSRHKAAPPAVTPEPRGGGGHCACPGRGWGRPAPPARGSAPRLSRSRARGGERGAAAAAAAGLGRAVSGLGPRALASRPGRTRAPWPRLPRAVPRWQGGHGRGGPGAAGSARPGSPSAPGPGGAVGAGGGALAGAAPAPRPRRAAPPPPGTPAHPRPCPKPGPAVAGPRAGKRRGGRAGRRTRFFGSFLPKAPPGAQTMGGRGGVAAGGGTSVAPGVMRAKAATGDREPQEPPHRPGRQPCRRRGSLGKRGYTRGQPPGRTPHSLRM